MAPACDHAIRRICGILFSSVRGRNEFVYQAIYTFFVNPVTQVYSILYEVRLLYLHFADKSVRCKLRRHLDSGLQFVRVLPLQIGSGLRGCRCHKHDSYANC